MKRQLGRIILGIILLMAAIFVDINIEGINITLYFISYVIVGGDIVWKAVKNITRGQVFDENFLMALATIGAMLIGEYAEATVVMLLYQIGELFQSFAVDKSRRSIASLMDIRPDYVNVMRDDQLVTVDPDDVHVGDRIIIKAGERVPLDAILIEGSSMLDTSALTGESVPREVFVGDELLSGCINVSGLIAAQVTKEYEESTVSKILDLVENASNKKSQSEQFITKFARYYTPIVVILALLLATVPPLIIKEASFQDWLYRALSFLVVSCPCALVISVPLTFFSGIGGASKRGILVKGSNYLEALANTEIIVFDKTGTLTKGAFNVQEVYSELISKEELLKLTAYAESYSNHPISQSIIRAYGKDVDQTEIKQVKEIAGHGVSATVFDKLVLVGNEKMMKEYKVSYVEGNLVGTVVHVAIDGTYAGYILISDEVKEDAKEAIQELKEANIKKVIMLTGDSNVAAQKVANELELDYFYAELLPGDKVNKLEELFQQKSERGKIAFVGDGINDAPVLARADIGIAMGGLGSDAAIEAADLVLMTDEPSKIATAIRISKKVLSIAKQNILFAITVKVAVLILSALGLASMWGAIFGDVGVTIIAIINSFRALQVRDL